MQYDEDGNITASEQTITIGGVPVVATTTYEYDANDNETVIVDPDGKRTEQTFNPLGLPLSRVVDPGGLNVTELFSYNVSGDVLTDTDPNGLTQTYTYNGSGNPTGWEDRDGFSSNFTYDSSGNLVGRTDDAGNTRSATYDSNGRATEEIDTLGNRTTYTWDANGNQTSQTVFRTIGGTLTPLVTTWEYDALDNVTRVVDAAGNETRFEYNAVGRKSAEIDPLARRTEFEYDAVGALIGTRFPDGTSESMSYDASGNVVSTTDRAGRTTQFEYDELNRRIRTVNPDGNDSRSVYTPGGRLAATIDGNGNRTEFEYDGAGRRVLIRFSEVDDVTGGSTVNPVVQFEYDVGGRQTAQIDPLGNRTEYLYDVANGTVSVRHPDGAEGISRYDHLGRLISTTNEDGEVTLLTYQGESPDRLASVQLPSPDGVLAGPLTQYSYDELGNRLNQTDALGRVTRFQYDLLNRMNSVEIPGGETRRMAYDAVGNLITQTDFDGLSVSYEYDSMNRPVRKNLPDGSTVDYGYTATGRRQEVQDDRGATTYAY
jgi:YD repeat-containing protein